MSVRVRLLTAILLTLIFTFPGVRVSEATPQSQARQSSVVANPKPTDAQSAPLLELPLTFERHVGDLDEMRKRHEIRILVVPSRSGFFYDQGQPQGIFYEAFNEFQRFVNQKYKTGSLKISVTYLPMETEQLEQALMQ